MRKLPGVLLASARRAWKGGAGGLLSAAWLIVLAGGGRVAGGVDAGGGRAVFQVWQPEDWEKGTVPALLQSREGYLWLGTYHGLVRFDGVRSQVFNAVNAPGLTNGVVTSLYEDSGGVLWIGHETGNLTRFKDGVFQAIKLGRFWPRGAIEAISSDEEGNLWLLNDSGRLYRVRDERLVESPGGGATASRKAMLARSPGGRLWVVSNGSVAALERGALAPCRFTEQDGTPGFYERVLPARDGSLWVLGNGRLRKWRAGRWVAECPGCPREPGQVTTLLEMRSGGLLAGTLKAGLYLFPPNSQPLHLSRTDGLSHDWVRCLCEDSEGDLWLGTGAGFDGLRARPVAVLNAPDAMQGCAVLSFALDPDGGAWIGTEGAGLYSWQGGQWRSFCETNGLPNAFVWSVLESRAGALYVGTWGGGLLVKRGDRFDSPGELARLTAPVVSLYEDRRGALWIGTIAGLYRFQDGKLTSPAGKDKLLVPDVRAIAEAADGTLWFGMSGGGLGSVKEGVLRQLRKQDGLGSDFVSCLYPEPDGTLWYGTRDRGLGRLKEGRFAILGPEQGIPGRSISHIVDDGAGNLWMGSERGILRASKLDLCRCADGAVKSIHCLSYGKAEGLASPMCSGGFQPGACRGPDGRLWFPTAKGLAIVDPAEVTTNRVAPPVKIEELRVGARTIWAGQGPGRGGGGWPIIPAGGQRFEFHYTGLSFAAPDKVCFQYKLEGLDADWVDAETRRVVEYSYLPPGKYRFRVTACNNNGVWNEEGASLAFTVLPHWWQTWWFDLLAAGGGAGAVGAGVLGAARRRLRRRMQQLERQRALERERTRIARDIHDDLGASLTRITLMSQSVCGELTALPEAAAEVQAICTTAREVTRALDEIVWAVNPRHDTLDSLATYLGRFAQQFLSAAGIRCRLDVPVHLPPWALSAEVRHTVFLAFKEALHNAVKHARATEVRISFDLLEHGFALWVVDNGCGFDWNLVQARGNGLLNMRKRLEEVGGSCQWTTAPSEGTRVRLSVIKTDDS